MSFFFIINKYSTEIYCCNLIVPDRSPVTHKMSPWVKKVFIHFLPKLLFIRRPHKDDPEEQDQHPEVITDAYNVPPDVDKFVNYNSKRFSGDYGIPGKYIYSLISEICFVNEFFFQLQLYLAIALRSL